MDRRADNPLITIVIPTYQEIGVDFLARLFKSLKLQTFKDFEVLVTDDSNNDNVKNFVKDERDLKVRYIRNAIRKGMGGNTNVGIQNANGELIKILYQDDYLAHPESLQKIKEAFTKDINWLVTGCTHTNGRPHLARYNQNIHMGVNTIGSPSVMTIRNHEPLLFDPNLSWVLDCDYYKRMYEKFGEPKVINDINVVIGIGDHQTTNKLSEDFKRAEIKFLINRYS